MKLLHHIKERWREIVPQKSLSEFSILSSGNVITVIITFIGYPILSRLYSASEFGEFALFQSIFIILLPLITLNYQESILMIGSRHRINQLLNSLLIISGAALMIILIFTFFSGFELFNITLPEKYLWILPLALFLGSIIQTGHYLLLWKEAFQPIAAVKVTERAGFQLSAIGLAFSNLPFNGLIIGMVSGQVLAFIITASKAFTGFTITLPSKLAKVILRKYRSFPLFALPGGLLERLSRHLPILLLAVLVSDAATGQYAMAYKILSLPEIIFGASIGQMFYLRVSKRYLAGKKIKPLILKTWGLQILIGLGPLLIIGFFGQEIFSFLLGEKWEEAGKIARIIALMMFFLFLTSPTSYALNALNKLHVDLSFGLITLISRAGALVVGLHYFDLHGALVLFTIVEAVILIAFNLFLLRLVVRWENQLLD